MIGNMELANTYLVLRHGRSAANDQHLIVSHAVNAIKGYGITPDGRVAVAASAKRAQTLGWAIDQQTCIVSSPFLRARESAQVVADLLDVDISLDDRLRERDFGDLELQEDRLYQDVWDADSKNPAHQNWGVESLLMVASRILDIINDIELGSSQRTILLCTHGDVASVLACSMLDLPLNKHREVGHLEPGELVMIDPKAGALRSLSQNRR
jgi:probable phosphoglycerate mutase